jgi:outer membrane protein OmpA-like peptidoglycan-associated protein
LAWNTNGRRIVATIALVVGVSPVMLNQPVHSDPDSEVVDARSIIGSLAQPHAKTRGLSVAPRSDITPEPGETPRSYAAARKIDLDIPFPNGSARLTNAADRQLVQLGAALAAPELRGARFRIAGHTSATGSPAFNQKLSKERAEAVRAYLIREYRIVPERLEASGYGATRLLPEFPQNADRQRRVEISAMPESQ